MTDCEIQSCENRATHSISVKRETMKFLVIPTQKVILSLDLCDDHGKAFRHGLLTRLNDVEK